MFKYEAYWRWLPVLKNSATLTSWSCWAVCSLTTCWAFSFGTEAVWAHYVPPFLKANYYMCARRVFPEALGNTRMLDMWKSCQCCWGFFYLNATCCFLAMYFALPSIYLADEHFRECLFSALALLRIFHKQNEWRDVKWTFNLVT